MATTWSLGFGTRSVRVDVNDVWLRGGPGAHEIRFDLKCAAPWLPDDNVDSWALMRLNARVDAGTGLALGPIGHAQLTCLLRRFPTTEHLTLVISDEQLVGLEAMRGQGDLTFQFDVTGTLESREVDQGAFTTAQERYVVAPRQWLDALDRVGSEIAITVRVPSPLTGPASAGQEARTNGASASQAALRLREARRELRDGNYEGCVQVCRLVLDNLRALMPPSSLAELKRVGAQDRTQTQRWSAIFHDLYSLASGANHDDGVTRDFVWARSDAQAVLAATAALLARVELP